MTTPAREHTDEALVELPYRVVEGRDGVTIEGLSRRDALDALALLVAARKVQYERGATAAVGVLRTMSEARLELTAPVAVEQARRLADLRQGLLATPAYSYETLAKARGDARTSATRTWVSRMRERRRLFTVQDGGRAVIPAFQLTDSGEPRPELAEVLRTLIASGVEGWTLWTWLTSATPLLSGNVPAEEVDAHQERVERAASRFAARRPVVV